MTKETTQIKSFNPTKVGLWFRIPILIRALFQGFVVSSIGVFSWILIYSLIPFLWGILAMGGALCVYCLYFSGRWGSKPTVEKRMKNFRMTRLSSEVWKKGILAAGLFVIISQSLLMVTFRLIEFPAELFTTGFGEYNFNALPLWIVWLYVIMASLVAGICEETGYRGYGQVPLENRYNPFMANIIVSTLFILIHLTQAWAFTLLIQGFILSIFLGYLAYKTNSLIPSIIGHTIMDIFNFSYWWSDIAGKFEYRPINVSGIDMHFILWLLTFLISLALFIGIVRSLKPSNTQKDQ